MACNCSEIEYKCGDKPKCVKKDCSCPVKIGTECWTYTGDDLECSSIKGGTIGTEVIQQLDAFICAKFEDVQNYFSLINIGSGAKVYKGMDLAGKKELRTITKTGNLIQITETDSEINITIDESALPEAPNQIAYTTTNVGSGAGVYKDTTILSPTSRQDNLRSIRSSNGTVTITEETDHINITVESAETTSITDGTNTTVTGTGTTADPFKINTVVDGSETKVQAGANISVTGTGTTSSPYNISATVPSSTQLSNGTYTTVTGTGASGSPYQVNVLQADVLQTSTSSGAYIQNKNPTKTVTLGASATYTVVLGDNNYVIEIDNGANNVTIDLAGSLGTNNFFVGFVQKGTGDVIFTGQTIVPTGTGNKLQGQGHVAAIEIINGTKYLHGNLKT